MGDTMKMDRTDVAFTDQESLQKEDEEYWAKASTDEKLEMMTYLRECFYGTEATTGRVEKIYEFVEQEQR
jgi:hypothetical protein